MLSIAEYCILVLYSICLTITLFLPILVFSKYFLSIRNTAMNILVHKS